MSKSEILGQFDLFASGADGIGGWLTEDTDSRVFDRLSRIEQDPLTKVQLNQLLAFGHEAPVSDDFFRYYWLSNPSSHPYSVDNLSGFEPEWIGRSSIVSLRHLHWGLYRLFLDALLYFGNVRTGYRALRALGETELLKFFVSRRFDTTQIRERGPALPLVPILSDQRQLELPHVLPQLKMLPKSSRLPH